MFVAVCFTHSNSMGGPLCVIYRVLLMAMIVPLHTDSEHAYLLSRTIDGAGFVVAVHEQDVLRLEICVRELVVVQEQHAVYELIRDVPHLL